MLFERLSGTIGLERYAPLVNGAARDRTPDSKYAGGHRIRVTPVPIPNTEVKPDTADGTAWETVWESRSLPALFRQKPAVVKTTAGFSFVRITPRVGGATTCAAWESPAARAQRCC